MAISREKLDELLKTINAEEADPVRMATRLFNFLQMGLMQASDAAVMMLKEQLTPIVIDWGIVDWLLSTHKEKNFVPDAAQEILCALEQNVPVNAVKLLVEDLKSLNEELRDRIAYMEFLKGIVGNSMFGADIWELKTTEGSIPEDELEIRRQWTMKLAEDQKWLNEELQNRIVELEQLKGIFDSWQLDTTDGCISENKGELPSILKKQNELETIKGFVEEAEELKRHNEELRNKVVEMERLKDGVERDLETAKARLSIAEDKVIELEQLKGSAKRELVTTKERLSLAEYKVVELERLKSSAERELETTKGRLSIAEDKVERRMEQTFYQFFS